MNLSVLDVAVLLAYLAGVTAMGIYFARRNVSTEEYFVGGRSFKGWVVGLSLVGTSISSISFLAFPGDAYKTGYLRMLPNFMLPVGLVIAAYVFLPFYRKNRITSAYEYLEMRFGPSVRVYGSLTFIAGQVMRISGILYLLSVLIQGVTDLSPITCILVGGVFVAFYTIVGGISAVMWTDVIQTVVLALGGLFCLAVVLYHLPGGIGQVIEVAGAADRAAALKIAGTIAQSALVKTAVAGADPNWGRIVSAAGYAGVPFDPARLRLKLNGFLLFQDGAPLAFDAGAVSHSIRRNRETRSEERRVGKECRSRWAPYH